MKTTKQWLMTLPKGLRDDAIKNTFSKKINLNQSEINLKHKYFL